MRFLFVFNTPGFLRYFDTTLERLLAGGHEVVLTFQRPDLRPESLEVLELENPRLRIVEKALVRTDDYAEVAETVRVCADYVRYLDPRFAELEYLRSRMRTRALRVSPFMHRFADRTSITGPAARAIVRFLLACERAIPSATNIESFISEVSPDAVLVSPLVTSASPQTDYVKSAQRLGIPAGLLVASWDNLTNKGLMRVVPDKVFVWNETQCTEAVKFHRVPRRRVVLTGAQPFDRWFGREPRETRAEFCTKVGLDPDFESAQAKLLEPLGFAPERLRRETCQGWAAPEREGLSKQLRRLLAVAGGKRGPPLVGPTLERLQIELVAVEDERVAAGAGHDRTRGKLVPETGNVDLNGFDGGLGWLLPELRHEPLERDRLPGSEQERDQYRLLLCPSHGKAPAAAVDDIERAQDAVLQRRLPPADSHN